MQKKEAARLRTKQQRGSWAIDDLHYPERRRACIYIGCMRDAEFSVQMYVTIAPDPPMWNIEPRLREWTKVPVCPYHAHHPSPGLSVNDHIFDEDGNVRPEYELVEMHGGTPGYRHKALRYVLHDEEPLDALDYMNGRVVETVGSDDATVRLQVPETHAPFGPWVTIWRGEQLFGISDLSADRVVYPGDILTFDEGWDDGER